MMMKSRMRTILVTLGLFCGIPCVAQQHAIGAQTFGSFSGGPDLINLGNLNVHLNIPVLHKQGRGIPFLYDLTYDSAAVWSPVTTGSVTTWTPQSGWGWPASKSAVGYVTSPVVQQYTLPCNPTKHTTITVTRRVYSGYVDIHGTLHHAPGLSTTTILGDPSCANGSTNGLATTDDGSGYTISIPYGATVTTATVTSKAGAQLTAPIGGGNATVANDANGNEITFNASFGQFFDTLSATTPVLTVTGTSPVNYTYTPPSGTAVSVVVSYKSYPVQTHFQCSNVTDYGASSPINNNLVDKITLADGSFYQFTYEPTTTGSQNVTGRVASVTFPTGGTISYAYTGSNGGINCADGSTLGFNRTTPDSTTAWQYSRSGSNPNWTTTVVDPLGNSTTYTMYEVVSTTTNGQASQSTYTYYETNRSAPGETILTCYNANYANCASASVSLPISQLDRYRTLGSQTALAEAIYDTSNNNAYGGRLKEQKIYDFGVNTGSAPSSTYLLTDTVITYAALTGIIDHPNQITVKDSGGNIKSQTTYAYDAGSVTTTSAPQHVAPPNGSRGNLTSITMLTSGTSTLSKTFTYYDTGNVNVATDVNGATATYTYGACGSSFPTNIAFSPITLTQQMTWDTNCTGAVMTSYTDPNGNVASTSYTTDPYFWRPEYATDLAGNKTNFSYFSLVQAESTLTFNGQNSESDGRIKLDGLGRPLVNQVQQGPNANYDSVETSYDALGRASFASLPYSAAAGVLCSGSCPGASASYDALGRLQTASDSGGGSVSYTYGNNDTYQSSGPAPSGEHTKDKQMEYDGAGRLASVCEVLTSGGSSCGQNSPASGYKTSYAYSVPAAGGSKVVVTQGVQTRTYIYDALGRLTSETNPETSNSATSYTYDSPTSNCPSTSAGDMIQKQDANGSITCFYYDALHRVTDVAVVAGSNSAPCKRFRYDNSTGVLGHLPTGVTVSNPLGRVVEAETDTCAAPITQSSIIADEWFSYSARGELTDLYESTPHSGGYYHSTATYWANGALASLSGVPGYTALTYGVDGEGRLNTAQQGTTKVVCDSTCSSTSTTFDPAGRPLVVKIGGTTDNDAYTYDPNTERMSTYTFTVGSTPTSMAGTLTWNQNGTLRQLAITDGFNSGGAQTCKFGTATVMGYDDVGRLLSADCGSAWTQTFSYDQFGNITKSGSLSWACPTCYNGSNQYNAVLSPSISYDADGNLLNDTFHTYTWDAYGHISSIDSTTCGTNGTCLTYDALGRMVEKSVNSVYTELLYSPVGKTAIMSGQTTTSAYFPLPAGETLYETGSTGGTQYFWHTDWLGSVRFASTVGGRASYFDRAFAPFGETYDNFGNTSGNNFTGDTQDTISGTYDTLYRELNPNQGRWISPDPAGPKAVDLSDPQTWNRYAYVRNSPVSRIDPTGMVDINPGMMYAMMGGGGGFGCQMDGLDTTCQMAYAALQSGGGVQCPNNNCGIGTSTPFQCAGSVCGYMSNEYVATHENEWNGVLYSNSEWQTFLSDRVDAQRQALADAISYASDSPDGSNWDYIYAHLQPLPNGTIGGNANFSWTGDVSALSFVPGYLTGGCEVTCRFGGIPSIHMPGDYILHLDSGNPLWGFGLGAFVHGFFDVLLGNINPSVPMEPW